MLDISNTLVEDLMPLQNSTQLQFFSARNTQIEIFLLQNNKNLLVLDIRNNQINDLSAIQKLSKLQALDAGQNQIGFFFQLFLQIRKKYVWTTILGSNTPIVW